MAIFGQVFYGCVPLESALKNDPITNYQALLKKKTYLAVVKLNADMRQH